MPIHILNTPQNMILRVGLLRGHMMRTMAQGELELVSGGIPLGELLDMIWDFYVNGIFPRVDNPTPMPDGGYGSPGDGVVPGDANGGC
jgi:hypothetical protein